MVQSCHLLHHIVSSRKEILMKHLKVIKITPIIITYVITISILINGVGILLPFNTIHWLILLAGIPLLIYILSLFLESIFASLPLEHHVNQAVSTILAQNLNIPLSTRLAMIFRSYAEYYKDRYPDNSNGVILGIYVGYDHRDKIMKRLGEVVNDKKYYPIVIINSKCFPSYRLDGFIGIKKRYFLMRFKKIK